MEIEEAIKYLKNKQIYFDEYEACEDFETEAKLNIVLNYITELQADKNKLINYIAVRENKTHEQVCKEFELGE